MSYLEHFLKETAAGVAAGAGAAAAGGGLRHGSVDSVEGDIEDNRAPSVASSKSNLSELSIVSMIMFLCPPLFVTKRRIHNCLRVKVLLVCCSMYVFL